MTDTLTSVENWFAGDEDCTAHSIFNEEGDIVPLYHDDTLLKISYTPQQITEDLHTLQATTCPLQTTLLLSPTDMGIEKQNEKMEDEHQDLFDFLIPLSPSKRKAENNNDESQHKRQKNEIQNQENIATKERHNEVNKEKTEIPKKKRTYKKREKKTALHHIQSALENVFLSLIHI